MTIKVAWKDQDKTLVHYALADAWSWADFRRWMLVVNSEAAGGEVFDAIIEFTEGAHIPADLLSMGRQLIPLIPENFGMCVVVSHSPLLHALSKVFVRTNPPIAHHLVHAFSLDEAYAFLEDHRRRRSAQL